MKQDFSSAGAYLHTLDRNDIVSRSIVASAAFAVARGEISLLDYQMLSEQHRSVIEHEFPDFIKQKIGYQAK